jgi:hypothetical protein
MEQTDTALPNSAILLKRPEYFRERRQQVYTGAGVLRWEYSTERGYR